VLGRWVDNTYGLGNKLALTEFVPSIMLHEALQKVLYLEKLGAN